MYGTCKVCGCTDNSACFNPNHGPCWWVNGDHDLCSHCLVEKIVIDPETIHPTTQKSITHE